MPIYEYECEDGHRSEHYSSISNRPSFVTCECGKTANRQYSAPFFSVEYIERQDYSESLGLKKGFNNRTELKNYMRKHNLLEGNPEDMQRARRAMKEMCERKADTGSYK